MKYIDIHAHTAGIAAGGDGCFISSELASSWKYRIYLAALGVKEEDLKRFGNTFVLAKLSEKLAESRFVGKAVVLALDGVVNSGGELDRSKTEMYVGNSYLAKELKRYENLLFGASVNPYRRDALDLLEQAKDDGAVLVKWLPAIQGISPDDRILEPFYRKLVKLDIPLLSHTGKERTFTTSHDELCDPKKLEYPLDLGVKVIAAHVATNGKNEGEYNFRRLLPLFKRFDNLYADISSLTQINKVGHLPMVLSEPSVCQRLVYGTDYPLPFFPLVSTLYHLPWMRLANLPDVLKQKNLWDRDVQLKRALNTPEEVFRRSAQVLGL